MHLAPGRRFEVVALAAATISLLPLDAVRASVYATPPAFKGAWVGMSVDAWRDLRLPPGVGDLARPACRSLAATGDRHGDTENARRTGADLTCFYSDPHGLDRSVRLDNGFRASQVRYAFVGGVLSEIRYQTSIDAYNDLTALYGRRYGKPVIETRDTVRTTFGVRPRVRQVWRTEFGSVELVDPASDPTKIRIRISNRNATTG